eukprot:TRINITY_DN56011_c0_g1_i1.p2 TRINITY_DN56011_c0_g1~~TRINITY_DN56011_c0_g1_i1.p2  ORF type:complete len:302 (+),score=110.98 TRINITY_DN56011_c0_g1_i1:91-906(+)
MTDGGSKPPELPDKTQRVFDNVNSELTDNIQFFIDCVPRVTARLTEHLEAVKDLNPKARVREEVHATPERERCLSPLLRTRTRGSHLTLGSAEELAASQEHPAAPQPPVSPVGGDHRTPPPPVDRELIRQMHALKEEAYEIRVMLSGVCDWIEMQMPPIKAEDNRGVAVQEQVIRHLVHMRTAIQSIYDRERVFFDKIAEYSSKYYENPKACTQWVKTILVWHQEHWDQLERDWREMRHIVVLAARLLSLNMDKLCCPRDGLHSGAAVPYM